MNVNFRVGQGFDVHALVTGRDLIIGGVHIPHTHGLQGHSDADVLLHAVTDAILGAAGLGDIGRHFPDTDPRYAGADSRVLLRDAMAKVAQAGWKVVNVDATVHAQAPKIGPHAAAMAENIAADLGIVPATVNIKAKTNEGLGYLGRKEGIAATVVALLAGVAPD
ncbi:MAG: 2-C-methyl-D-erythritol 2,4-cyclodiphosphate synthase [Burkholderiaceae bacterium]